MEATYASRREGRAADYYPRSRGSGQQLSSRNYDRSYYDHDKYQDDYQEYPSSRNTVANNSRGHHQSSRRTRDVWNGTDVDSPVNPPTYPPQPDLAFSSMVGSTQGSRRPSVSQSRPQTRSGPETGNLFGQLLDGLAAYHQEKLRSAAAAKTSHSRAARPRRSDTGSDDDDDGLIYGNHSDSDGYYPRRSTKQMPPQARDATERYRGDRPRPQPTSRDHSPHSRPRTRHRQSSYQTEEREPTWVSHSRRASRQEEDGMPTRQHAERPRSRRPSYSTAEDSTVAALENLVQIERRAVDKCRARLQRASQHPSVTSRDLRELVDDLRSHEESYEAATRNLRETVQQQKLSRAREEAAAAAAPGATTASRDPPSRRSSYHQDATGFAGSRSARGFEEREPPPTAPVAEETPRPRAHQRRHTERRQFSARGAGDEDLFDKDAFAAFRQRRNTEPLHRIFEHLNRAADGHFTSTRLPGGGFHFRASFGGAGAGGGPTLHRAFDDHEDIFRAFFENLPPGFDFPEHPFFPFAERSAHVPPGGGAAGARGQQQQQYKSARNAPTPTAPRMSRPPPPPANLLTPDEARRWFQTYTDRWTALTPTDPNIPFPARGLAASALAARDSLHAPGLATPVAAWSEEAVLQANVQAFFLGAVGLAPRYTEHPASRKVVMGLEGGDGGAATAAQRKALLEVLKKEKVRWHSDRLGRRNGGGDGVNEALQKDERARAVFHAVCELMERVQESGE